MKKKDNDPLVDEYLKSLEGMRDAELNPFFNTRLKSKLDGKRPVQTGLTLRPAYVVGTLLILLLINLWMINAREKSETYSAVSSISGFAEAYNFTVPGY